MLCKCKIELEKKSLFFMTDAVRVINYKFLDINFMAKSFHRLQSVLLLTGFQSTGAVFSSSYNIKQSGLNSN